MDMYDFRLFVRECVKTGKTDEIIKILIEENVIPQNEIIEELICPKCALYDSVEDNYCQYAGECTPITMCKYFIKKKGIQQ